MGRRNAESDGVGRVRNLRRTVHADELRACRSQRLHERVRTHLGVDQRSQHSTHAGRRSKNLHALPLAHFCRRPSRRAISRPVDPARHDARDDRTLAQSASHSRGIVALGFAEANDVRTSSASRKRSAARQRIRRRHPIGFCGGAGHGERASARSPCCGRSARRAGRPRRVGPTWLAGRDGGALAQTARLAQRLFVGLARPAGK